MEINLKKLGEQEVTSTTTSKNMRLSDNATSMVFQLFTKNVYSNPIGTVVREITSNCFDSHTEAGVDFPVLIKKSVDPITRAITISFIDYGVGMSPDRIENVYGVYFESTKRIDNTQIGGFGIGGKTPLAYKRSTGAGEGEYDNSFTVITNHDKTQYTYLIYEGDESPVISLLNSKPTKERNGTEIQIPVLEKDIQSFTKEMVRQLYYFENIVFEGFEDDYRHGETLTNEYQIIRAKSFLFRGNEYSGNVHVCLGRVAYPLDYEVLGLSSSDYGFPVALRLEVGDIGVTVSREQLDYSEKTIKVLKKKLIEVKAELTAMLAKQYENIVTLEDYFKVKNQFGQIYFPNGATIDASNIINQKDVDFSSFKYSFLKMPTDKQLFRFFFETKLYGKKEPTRYSWRQNNSENKFEGSYEAIIKNSALYFYDDEFQRKIIKQAYLKSKHVRYYLISKNDLANKDYRRTVADLFNTEDDLITTDDAGNVTGVTAFCQSLIDMQEEFMTIVREHCTDYESIDVPEEFIEERKREKISEEMRNTTIPIRFAYGYRSRIKLDALFNMNVRIFYGTQDDEHTLRNASRMFQLLWGDSMLIDGYSEYSNSFDQKKGVMFLQLAQNNIKYMEFCKNAEHISNFKQTMLRRKEDAVLNYFQIKNFTKDFYKLEKLYRSPAFAKLSEDWAKKISNVQTFVTAIEKDNKNDWERYREELARYFPINETPLTKEQEVHAQTIADALEMQEVNAETMEYIETPYDLTTVKDSYWNMMKKVLVF